MNTLILGNVGRNIWQRVPQIQHARLTLSTARHSPSVVSTRSLSVGGIFPPIATPFNEDETVAYDKLEHNFNKWNKIPFKGYVVLGSNGEFGYLNWDERIKMVEMAKKLTPDGKMIIAGSGCESTRDTILLTNKMAKAGAQVALVLNPFFFKGSMNNKALINHFTKVADQSSIPILVYNVPKNTGMDIPLEVVVKLASHPNIIGTKDSSGDITRIASLVFQTQSEDFQILAGSAGFLLSAYNVGCVGGVCALANVLGEEVCRLGQLAHTDDLKAAMDLQLRLVGPNSCVTQKFGVPGLKTAMSWFGYYGGPTRSPLVPMEDNETDVMRQIFKKSLYL